ncbi:putative 3-methyladenine DNA glycosylase isoform X5 [Procambarus clarkii]|uniref:putative 3-methyladenine DNA glycosylase isoform X5 n=1 Tax=Procambarus clarkii TaxID=6728 RepID=UPI00374258BF
MLIKHNKLRMPKRCGRKLANICTGTKVVRTIDSSAAPCVTVSSYFVESNRDLDQNNGCETVNVMVDNVGGSEEKIYPLEERERSRNSLLRNTGVTGDAESSEGSIAEGSRLSEDFYDQDSVALAKALLGQVVVRVVEGARISGIIVETESYLGGADAASHSFNGKRTARTEPMYMKPGTSYVYSIYGMYYCFNISSKEYLWAGKPHWSSVVRWMQPLGPISLHASLRVDLFPCLGVTITCSASVMLHVGSVTPSTRSPDTSNKVDLTTSETFWLEHGRFISEDQIIVTKRVGIDSCGEEWAKKPLRFYVYNNKFVSVRDKEAENNLKGS